MIRKANLIFLTVLPILVLTFGIVHMRTALATTYTGECPNVIGTMNNCPSGQQAGYVGELYWTCHSLIVYNSGGRMDLCCQYKARRVACFEGSVQKTTTWPVEYYDFTNQTVCDSGYSGVCDGASVTL